MKPKHALDHWESSKVRGYDVDQTKQISIPALIRLMHEAAVHQVIQMKLSALELEPRGLGWVLYQQYLEVFSRPLMGDTVRIRTYPSGKQRAFTYRDYLLYDAQSQLLAQARTCWLLMDIKERRIASYPPDIEQILLPTNDFKCLARPQPIKVEMDRIDHEQTQQVGYHDLDFNGHLSNTFFFTWMLDALDEDFLRAKELISWYVQVKAECLLNDRVTSQIEKISDHVFGHRLQKNGIVVALGQSTWQNRDTHQ